MTVAVISHGLKDFDSFCKKRHCQVYRGQGRAANNENLYVMIGSKERMEGMIFNACLITPKAIKEKDIFKTIVDVSVRMRDEE